MGWSVHTLTKANIGTESSCDRSVAFVPRNYLCSSCGACKGVCPHDAITLCLDSHGIFTPKIDPEKCTQCELCVRVCPGHGFDYRLFQKLLFGGMPENVALGHCLKVYTGYASDSEILGKSQSGGFVSAMLCHGLASSWFDGAVVSRWKPDDPLCPETIIARTREEILSAVGSKYIPIPAAAIISDLLKQPGKYAFVGTSCQIQAMRKAETVFPKLANRIVLYIGLHCLGVCTFHLIDQLLFKIRLTRDEVKSFVFRDKKINGWPTCDTKIESKDGNIVKIDSRKARIWPRPFFTNWRCFLCIDKANEFSDISCGDCRIERQVTKYEREGYNLKEGLSEVVVRSKRGKSMIDRLLQEQAFVMQRSTPEDVVNSIGMIQKMQTISFYARIAKLHNKLIPNYGNDAESVSTLINKPFRFKRHSAKFLIGSILYNCFDNNRFRFFRFLLKLVPHRILAFIYYEQVSRWNKTKSMPLTFPRG